jgi:tRNA1(Val) A37 N6-methylase TrmN6
MIRLEFLLATVQNMTLVVSNPPYFTDSLRPPTKGSHARHNDMLEYSELVRYSAVIEPAAGLL